MLHRNTNSGLKLNPFSGPLKILMAVVGLSLAGHGPALSEPVNVATQGGSVVAGSALSSEAVTLGMPYVVPPHVPGSKVRTPEGLAPLLAERLQKQMPLQAVAVPVEEKQAAEQSTHARLDALLLPLSDAEARQQAGTVIPTGYRAGIMAIMRTDTDIRQWDDLRGRTVCLAEGSGLAGQMEARYGAIEKVFRAPADALLDLRIGGCDAAVHDSTMLQALLQFPEWQKFSASLPIQQERDLAFIIPEHAAALAGVLQEQVRQWQDNGVLASLTKQATQDIAFEVYMDQEVPDCH